MNNELKSLKDSSDKEIDDDYYGDGEESEKGK